VQGCGNTVGILCVADFVGAALRAQLGQADQRERQGALEQAEAVARLHSQLSAAEDAQRAATNLGGQLRNEVESLRQQLTSSREEATGYRAEAHARR
jgi:hypothetical protein